MFKVKNKCTRTISIDNVFFPIVEQIQVINEMILLQNNSLGTGCKLNVHKTFLYPGGNYQANNF